MMVSACVNSERVPSMLWLLRSDLHRIRGRTGVGEWLRQMVVKRTYRAVFTYRWCHWCRASDAIGWRALGLPAALLHRLFTGALGSEIPIKVPIGPGFLLLDGYGVVINAKARIGSNVTLFHHVTIGASAKGVPVVDDRAVVAAHSIVIGPVTVGADAVVGAGSGVTRDVPPSSVVAGNPAKVIASGKPGRARNVWMG